jgi:protein-S-isoprenylcysteine O-methyltransferase Ste14
VCIAALFFYVHGAHALKTHSLASVFFAIEQALLVGMFLTRRRSTLTSTRPSDWFVATVGGWLPLAARPADVEGLLGVAGTVVQVAGLSGVILSFAALGRSFGIVAASRGLKDRGPYGVVRHPIYLAHTLTLTGFTLANPTWINLAILVVGTIAQLLRIRAEERVLMSVTDYTSYRQRVRWRLVPGIY